MNLLWCGVAAAGVSLGTALAIRQAAARKGFLTDPRQLRYYSARRPLFGVVAVAVGFWVGVALLFLGKSPIAAQDAFFGSARFSSGTPLLMIQSLFWASFFLLLAVVGSDRRHDRGYYDWFYVIGSAVFISLNQFTLGALSVPWIGEIDLPVVAGVLATVLWVVVVVGAVEVLESIAGVLTLIPVLAVCGFFYCRAPQGEVLQQGLCLAFIGALSGFWPVHGTGQGIVLGKSGNKVVGFLLAAITLISRRKATFAGFIILPMVAFLLYLVFNSAGRLEKRVSR